MDISTLTYRQKLELRVLLNNDIESMENSIKAALESGSTVAGFRLKAGRVTRKISNEVALVQGLQGVMDYTELYTAKLAGIPALEKALKAKGMTPTEVTNTLTPFITSGVSAQTLEYTGEVDG